MANGVIKVGDKYYKRKDGEKILSNIDVMTKYSDGLADYLKDNNYIKASLKEYFNEKGIDNDKIEIMSDELSSMIINIVNMAVKISFEPINRILEDFEINEETAEAIGKAAKAREEAKKFRDRFKECSKVQCAKCKRFIELDKAELDHIIPVSLGGTSDPSNLQFLCHKCHMEKHHGVKED